MVLVIQLSYFLIPVYRSLVLGNIQCDSILDVLLHVLQQTNDRPVSVANYAAVSHFKLLGVFDNYDDAVVTAFGGHLQAVLLLLSVLYALF